MKQIIYTVACLCLFSIQAANPAVMTAEKDKVSKLSEEERKEGFKYLFDGSSMDGWTGNTTEYVLEDGCIVMHPTEEMGGNLYSGEEFDDFVLRFDFLLTPGANNGLGIRHKTVEKTAGYSGMELQILDSEAPEYKDLKPYQYHGSVYGYIPAKRGHLKPAGEWNTQEVTATGNRITVKLNGVIILDGDLKEATKDLPADRIQNGLFRKKGNIAFLGHGSVVKFKNIRIKPLKIPLPEHPRPDFERSEWLNLNGEWHFTFDRTAAEKGISDGQLSGFDLKIQVPFPWGSKLSGVESKGDVGFYGRNVTVPEAWKGKRIFLVIGACEWETNVWLDGALLGNHRGGYTPFEFELTDRVRLETPQTLVVSADDTPSDSRLNGKQGYGDARGIWQTVYLEARGENFIDYVHFSPDIDRSVVKVETALDRLPAKNMQIRVRFKSGGQPDFIYPLKGKALGTKTQQFEIKLADQHLWEPDDPWLYETEVSLLAGEQTVDCAGAYFGQRKIGVVRLPGEDYPYVALNNRPVYLQLTLDQSYHPDGFYTFPSDQFMRDEILLSKRLGLNGNRIHIKAEIPRKLYWADKLGLLIMADIPNWWGEPGDEARKDWEYCMRQQVKRDFNHPSVFAWVDFNETWGLFSTTGEQRSYLPETQEWVRRMYLEHKKLDPTRLVEDNSACNHDHVQTDLNTWHAYLPGYLWKEALDSAVKNTYAGSGWNFTGGNRQDGAPMLNSECGNVWGYSGSTGDIDFTWDYHIMMNEFRSHPLCAGWLYTEHHDVINEWNGYVRYDRSPKYDGLDAFVPGMTLADLHTFYYIAPQGDLCREAKAGATVEIPLFASFMTDRNPGALRLETSLAGWDALGNESLTEVAAYPVAFKPYLHESIAPAKVTLPEQKGLYVLRYELKTADGTTLGRNFSLLRVKEGKNPATDRKTVPVTVDPAQFSDAQWTYRQWNVLDGLKVNGAGSGYFEYTIPWPQDVSLGATESVTLVLEASAKKLHGKDAEDSNDGEGDYMRGKGMLDPSKNKNAYPMTGRQTFPSYVKISVNGKACSNTWLPDDPADHRGALSWFSQPHDKSLHEAGSYGYLVRTLVPVAALTEGEDIRIRLEVPDGVNGGLAIYGKDFGRYPLDPTLVFVKK